MANDALMESVNAHILEARSLMRCDDCQKTTDWPHAIQRDPWGNATGDYYCENCAEKRWDRQQERLMEET